MSQKRDGIKDLGKALIPLRKRVEFGYQFWIHICVWIGLPQQVEDAAHASNIFHHDRGDQTMPLT